jgi:tyrosyl-tRNA synthetase
LEQFHPQVTQWTSVNTPGAWMSSLYELLRKERKLKHNMSSGQAVLTVPILEGLDGVQKMSKSYGNAIGIKEPPLEMYGKLMSISDEMMWRYYELLTDIGMVEIRAMKGDVMNSRAHPMALKKELARMIVTDFHSTDAARKAGEDWAKQFQTDEVPESVPGVEVRFVDVCAQDPFKFKDVLYTMEWPIRIDKLLSKGGFVSSNTEGARKIKERAVKVNRTEVSDMTMKLKIDNDLLVRCGRTVKNVRVYV